MEQMKKSLTRLGAILIVLSVFSSVAQASWSGPVYTVTAYKPPTVADSSSTTAPRMWGTVWMDTSIAGTAKATFTWVHDTPNDAPPTDVYILQHGLATWSYYSNFLPHPYGAISPSIQSVSFPLRREPRFYLAQTQTGSGTADDGLGDAQVMTYDANKQPTGTSKGDKVVLCHPGTDGTLIVPAVTLSAIVPKPPVSYHYLPEWSYSVQLMDLKITCNSQDITGSKPAYQAKAGQNTALSFSGVPTGVTATSPSWALPDKYVKDWVHSDTSASIVSLPATALSSPSIPQLFWVSGGKKAVSFTANINGASVSLKGNINVDRPEYAFSLTPGGVVKLDADGVGGAVLKLGDYNPATTIGSGVIFGTNPAKPNPNNILTTVQVITNTTRLVVDGRGYLHTYTPTSGLDALNLGSDSPFQGVYATDKEVTVSDSFDTWLMYNPPTGGTEHQDWIYVPLKKLSWSWAGHANRRGASWVATTAIDATNTTSDLISGTSAKAATGSDTLIHPTWTQKASAGTFVPAR